MQAAKRTYAQFHLRFSPFDDVFCRSFLLAILGELLIQQGDVASSATAMAYCGHDSWILNASARANILIGHSSKAVDEARYRESVRACALLEDFRLWRKGERTLLGQRGINISGGQKARIALARALYSEAPVLLLDNVLAGLDVTTSAVVFQEAVLRSSKGRVVLLSTHVQQFHPFATGIIELVEGTARLIEQTPLGSAIILNPSVSSQEFPTLPCQDGGEATFVEIPSTEVNSYVEYVKVGRPTGQKSQLH